ncbi:unnamed protein product, partial [marine sediment metagenome]
MKFDAKVGKWYWLSTGYHPLDRPVKMLNVVRIPRRGNLLMYVFYDSTIKRE